MESSDESEWIGLGVRPDSDSSWATALSVKPQTQTERGPAECSLLQLAPCSLNLNNNPFHYVAPASTLSTDQSRFLDDTQRTAGVAQS